MSTMKSILLLISGTMILTLSSCRQKQVVKKTNKESNGLYSESSSHKESLKASMRNPLKKESRLLIEASLKRTNDTLREAKSLLVAGNITESEKKCLESIRFSPMVNGKRWNTQAIHFLGEIYLYQGKNQQALNMLLESHGNQIRSSSDPDIALAFCRLNHYQSARKYYDENWILQFSPVKEHQQLKASLPGVDSTRTLEASILADKGAEYDMEANPKAASECFIAASRLVPNNGYVAFGSAKNLMELKEWQKAKPYLEIAIKYGKGRIYEDAKEKLDGINHWILQKEKGNVQARLKDNSKLSN